MKLYIHQLLILIFIIALSINANSNETFEKYFHDKALRIDLNHIGNWVEEKYTLNKLIQEPYWSGTLSKLIDTSNLGKYLIKVFDINTNQMIYSRGFCTLFGEWQTTDEAKTSFRTFFEALRIPFPKNKILVKIAARDDKMNFNDIFSVPIDPNDYNIIKRVKYSKFKTVDLENNGDYHKKVDILILPEGYSKNDIEKMNNDAKRFCKALFSFSPYKEKRNMINVKMIEAFSNESGITEPRKGIFKDTILGASFNTFDSERYLTIVNTENMMDISANTPTDFFFIMVNTSRYGGGGIYNLYAVYISDNEFDSYVFIHEFGHSFAGLGDEYYSSQTSYNDFYSKGVEPWDPNITALLDPNNLKWKHLLSPNVPIPTPPNRDLYKDSVGAFEGAGYVAKGLFRPQLDCIMFTKNNVPFCKVCAEAIEKQIYFYSEE